MKSRSFNDSSWKVALASRSLLLVGTIDVLTATFRPLNTRLHSIATPLADIWPTIATAGVIIDGVILIALSFSLNRRSHIGYLITQIALTLNIPLHLITGHLLFLLSVIPITFLLHIRHEFYAKAHTKILTRASIVFSQILALSVGIGIFLILAPERLFGGEVTAQQVMRTVINGLFGNKGPLTFVSNRQQDVFNIAMIGLGILIILAPLLILLQPNPPKPRMTSEDEIELRALVSEFGARDSVGYFALREDKSVIWSKNRRVAITYRVIGGCALVSGDPIGNPDSWPQIIHLFMELCAQNRWTAACIGCSEEAGEIWVRETKMSALEIGDEAVVHVKDYDPESSKFRNIRQSMRRPLKLGYATNVVRSSELSPEMRARLTSSANSWRGSDSERGFMMGLGRIADVDEPDLLIVTASKEQELMALLQFIPWGTSAFSLDLMRRSPRSESGINELLIDATITYLREIGMEKVSLNFAAFRSVFDRGSQLGAGPVIRSWRSVLLFFSRWIQMETLYRFNAKFRPEWVPRFAVYQKASDLPKIGMAILRAEALVGSRKTEARKPTALG